MTTFRGTVSMSSDADGTARPQDIDTIRNLLRQLEEAAAQESEVSAEAEHDDATASDLPGSSGIGAAGDLTVDPQPGSSAGAALDGAVHETTGEAARGTVGEDVAETDNDGVGLTVGHTSSEMVADGFSDGRTTEPANPLTAGDPPRIAAGLALHSLAFSNSPSRPTEPTATEPTGANPVVTGSTTLEASVPDARATGPSTPPSGEAAPQTEAVAVLRPHPSERAHSAPLAVPTFAPSTHGSDERPGDKGASGDDAAVVALDHARNPGPGGHGIGVAVASFALGVAAAAALVVAWPVLRPAILGPAKVAESYSRTPAAPRFEPIAAQPTEPLSGSQATVQPQRSEEVAAATAPGDRPPPSSQLGAKGDVSNTGAMTPEPARIEARVPEAPQPASRPAPEAASPSTTAPSRAAPPPAVILPARPIEVIRPTETPSTPSAETAARRNSSETAPTSPPHAPAQREMALPAEQPRPAAPQSGPPLPTGGTASEAPPGEKREAAREAANVAAVGAAGGGATPGRGASETASPAQTAAGQAQGRQAPAEASRQPQPPSTGASPLAPPSGARTATPALDLPPRLDLRAGERRSLAVRITPRPDEDARLLLVLRQVPDWLSLSIGGAVGGGIWLLPAHQAAELALVVSDGAKGAADLSVQLTRLDGQILGETLLSIRIQTAAGPAPSRTAVPTTLDDDTLARLQARSDLLLDTGEVEAARTILRSAAEAGSVAAAIKLAETYDPREVTRLGVTERAADPALAAAWYRHAQALGSPVAGARLATLEPR